MKLQASALQSLNVSKTLVSRKLLSVPSGVDGQDSFAVFTSEAGFLRKQGVVQ